jgi:hypothetical protein
MNTEVLDTLKIGYKQQCDLLSKLVNIRLNTNASEILEHYLTHNKDFVEDYCSKYQIDSWVVMQNKQAKVDLGLALITADIKLKTLAKGVVDKFLVEYNIPTINITNSIESESKWLLAFGSPFKNKGLTQRSNKILSGSNIPLEIAEEITKAIEYIKPLYESVLPNILRPDLDTYWNIVEYPMSSECAEYLTKLPGK